jgi:hypothetical protein
MALLWRLPLLLALMAAVAWIDWRRHGDRATKWREYGFLLAVGLLGGMLGVAIDQITATISPEYFVVGKGIAHDDYFRLNIALFGFQGGLVAGMAIGGMFLIANNPRPDRPSLPTPRLFWLASWPIWIALAAVPFGCFAALRWDPIGLAKELSDVISLAAMAQFLAVWGIHLGLYVGGAVGAVFGVVRVRRLRTKAWNSEKSD